MAPVDKCSKLRDQIRELVSKEDRDGVQCIRPQDKYLSEKLDEGDVLITFDEAYIECNTDLKMPVSPLLINFEFPDDI